MRFDVSCFIIYSYQFVKVIKKSGTGLKAFTSLEDYYVHFQIRNIENFPVIILSFFSIGSKGDRQHCWNNDNRR